MKAMKHFFGKGWAICMTLIFTISMASAQSKLVELKGSVLASESEKPLESAILSVKGTNISTVTNADGQFSLKIDASTNADKILVSHPGYKNKELPVNNFQQDNLTIYLNENLTELSQVFLTNYTDAESLVREVLKKKKENNLNQSVLMTAFYREAIKRRRKNVSLTEAVVELEKKPYSSSKRDEVHLQIARKKTNYKRLDTLAFKLQGGPFTTLYIDIMKYPEYIFTYETLGDYEFTFAPPSSIDNRPVYVVNFKQKEGITALRYTGTLYIDAESVALASANYRLNLENKSAIRNAFVKKKPRDVIVYPTETAYKVKYRQKNNKWYYTYGSVELTFKVNKKRKLFNQVYSVSSEMAVTDWEIEETAKLNKKGKDKLRPSVILADRISGFSDPNFWGEYNLIEPEKSIETAIEKIKRQIKREERRKS